ncbi:MAG: ROK family protein, partial [Sphingobacteriaceae bacterium]
KALRTRARSYLAQEEFEDYISTRWLLQRYKQMGGTMACDVKQLAEMYTTDEFAAQLFDEFGSNLAEFINNALCSFKVNTIVLGGNIAKAYPLFKASLLESLDNGLQIDIVQAELGEQASLLGASSLWYAENMQNTAKGAFINVEGVVA